MDASGRSQFYELLRHRGEPVFYAFDCLMYNGRDLRALPLTKRKAILKRIIGEHPRTLLARHFDRDGSALFRLVCENDLEGIVAKRKNAAYGVDWFKIRNPAYSQYEGAASCWRGASATPLWPLHPSWQPLPPSKPPTAAVPRLPSLFAQQR